MRWLGIILLAVSLSGCALMQAVNKLEGQQLLDLVKAENSAGCINARLDAAHLGMAGAMRVLATWGKNPPPVTACMGTVIQP